MLPSHESADVGVNGARPACGTDDECALKFGCEPSVCDDADDADDADDEEGAACINDGAVGVVTVSGVASGSSGLAGLSFLRRSDDESVTIVGGGGGATAAVGAATTEPANGTWKRKRKTVITIPNAKAIHSTDGYLCASYHCRLMQLCRRVAAAPTFSCAPCPSWRRRWRRQWRSRAPRSRCRQSRSPGRRLRPPWRTARAGTGRRCRRAELRVRAERERQRERERKRVKW